jgi:hypothetical protein
MWMDKLSMMMDLAGKVRVILLGGLEHHLSNPKLDAHHDIDNRHYLILTLEPFVSLCVAR